MAAAAATTSSDANGRSAATPKPRRGANLLRDYYGLSNPGPGPGPDSPAAASSTPADPTDPDNPAFSKDAALAALLRTGSLSQLLAKESTLITEIRELDGERQSLVYNHHHQLVAASDTIRNMKQKSESLDPSLDALRESFSRIAQLETNLETLRSPIPASGSGDPGSSTVEAARDMLPDLEAIVTLPTALRDLIEFGIAPIDGTQPDAASSQGQSSQGLAQAERLWGQMEAVLSAWSDAGVQGVREIIAECRSVLREGRRAAGATQT
ncbi:uncharacterized protein PFL1_01786 [Pseudozyma flocculosa PF-1]|uniref:Vacuolar protein sorting-associated protein 51 homolog n=1 Tax=Pseudozyma flocculosa TaxID=84751 RepID=A0A5C3EXC6_9BASI|nr:uncharacterized protein PFL1_01786 [Pseudozyma flocculosa PF-1]EPQ30889.1 hypothetical protein PFL1_01786 [Pseudozyma flocculosa PF-1]SPO36732.1 uncharacterized protein PSFLO_02203 [Pseudozyma flocculosa]